MTLLKFSIAYAIDHTLSRKEVKTMDDIDAFLGRLEKLEGNKWLPQTLNVEQYKLQLQESLRTKLLALESIRSQKLRRANERNAEPKGIQRWLLLYRPEGVEGGFIQLFYYAFSLGAIILLVEMVNSGELWHDIGFAIVGGGTVLLYALVSLYLRSIALRLKGIGNLVRLKSLRNPNRDLSWLRSNLLVLKKGDGLWLLRFLFYDFLLGAVLVSLPITSEKPGIGIELLAVAFMLSLSQIIRIDALSRRARTYLRIQTPS